MLCSHAFNTCGNHDICYIRRIFNQVGSQYPLFFSIRFAAVNRDNAKDVVSVRRDVRAINDMALYRGVNV